MLEVLYYFSNLILPFIFTYILFIRIKNNGFGKIPKLWEKLGWLILVAIIALSIGNCIEDYRGTLTMASMKVSRIANAVYFIWYLITLLLYIRPVKK